MDNKDDSDNNDDNDNNENKDDKDNNDNNEDNDDKDTSWWQMSCCWNSCQRQWQDFLQGSSRRCRQELLMLLGVCRSGLGEFGQFGENQNWPP